MCIIRVSQLIFIFLNSDKLAFADTLYSIIVHKLIDLTMNAVHFYSTNLANPQSNRTKAINDIQSITENLKKNVAIDNIKDEVIKTPKRAYL